MIDRVLTRRELLALLRHVAWRQGGALAEEEFFHLTRDQFLRFFLPWHQSIFIEDHLLTLFPQLPRLRRNIVVNTLTEFSGPWRRIETGKVFLKLHTPYGASARIANGLRGE
jgi:hypothetical protein